MLSQELKIFLRRAYVSLLPSCLRSSFQEMFPNYYLDAKVIFIHVPKAAGTSISYALYSRNIPHLPAALVRELSPPVFEKLPSFTVVRNPWDRLVSAYHYAIGGGGGVPASTSVQVLTKKYQSLERFAFDHLTRASLCKEDFIYRTQKSFLTDKQGRLMVDEVFRFEDMGAISDMIFERYGAKLEVRNRSVRKSYREYYKGNSKLVDLVGDIYSDDIKMFNYDF